MTGYGRAETDDAGTKFSVELNSVNRKQSDIVINLPRDLAELEPRIRQTINEKFPGAGPTRPSLCTAAQTELANSRSTRSSLALITKRCAHCKRNRCTGEITIGTILQAPGVMRFPKKPSRSKSTALGRTGLAQRSPNNQNAGARRQTPGQGFDSSSQRRSEKIQRSPRASSGSGKTISRRAGLTESKRGAPPGQATTNGSQGNNLLSPTAPIFPKS